MVHMATALISTLTWGKLYDRKAKAGTSSTMRFIERRRPTFQFVFVFCISGPLYLASSPGSDTFRPGNRGVRRAGSTTGSSGSSNSLRWQFKHSFVDQPDHGIPTIFSGQSRL